jgi:tetratricopeptide (TPR) repeat protein
MLVPRFGAIISVVSLLAGIAGAGAESPQTPECTAAFLYARPDETTIDVCTAILQRSDLDSKLRVESLKIRGQVHAVLGHYDESVRDYTTAMLFAPTDPELYVWLGEIALLQGDVERAGVLAEKAIALDISYARAFALRGEVSWREGDLDATYAAFDKAIQLEPGDVRYHFNRFRLIRTRWSAREAVKEADLILRMPKEVITEPSTVVFVNVVTDLRTGVRVERAKLLNGMGRFADAEAAFDEAIKDDPSGLTYAWRAEFRMHRNMAPELVQTDVDKALSLEPKYWLAHHTNGRLHFYARRYDTAAAEFAVAAKLAPTNGEPLWWRSMALRKLDRFDEATADALAAIEVDKDMWSAKTYVMKQYGYLQGVRVETPTVEAFRAGVRELVRNAVAACMLDERCW